MRRYYLPVARGAGKATRSLGFRWTLPAAVLLLLLAGGAQYVLEGRVESGIWYALAAIAAVYALAFLWNLAKEPMLAAAAARESRSELEGALRKQNEHCDDLRARLTEVEATLQAERADAERRQREAKLRIDLARSLHAAEQRILPYIATIPLEKDELPGARSKVRAVGFTYISDWRLELGKIGLTAWRPDLLRFHVASDAAEEPLEQREAVQLAYDRLADCVKAILEDNQP